MNEHMINWESVVAVMAVLELLRALVIYFLVAPLRAAGSKIANLEREVSEAKLGETRADLRGRPVPGARRDSHRLVALPQ